ncbi:hypothetical protein DESUT3_33210 [Desulfuromonas versatilis]|uniref:Capsule synthesis protein CapA domain-containing protein n=1 Tax=Desulfuromonas versatilis TaxID=2802975 RepID=A0ABM8HVB5_9BACT|nr:CapA family protein [Desulfuromonas versatilis]BCR06252.1 hypothetical protein DESUT3_33210 [Desulfuromonas versatilis]
MPGRNQNRDRTLSIFLCGDLMTGRGIDQILPHPGDPRLHEPVVEDARRYVELAERAHGPIPRGCVFAYPWGDALAELQRRAPDLRLANLETSITVSNDYWPGKGINYRMHPKNAPVLSAAGIGVCALGNNHVLDWGYAGLAETLRVLDQTGIRHAGAGASRRETEAPAVVALPGKGRGRVLVFSFGAASSGIPGGWAATDDRAGVALLPDFSATTIEQIRRRIAAARRPGDLVIASLHWGGNWGYAIPHPHRSFAHRLIDEAGVDLVHGHSSHHPIGIEVYRERLILYGCGDLLTDYEGIAGYEEFRADLGLLYFAELHPRTRTLAALEMVPLQTRNFRLQRASKADARWLMEVLNREGRGLGTRTEITQENALRLLWE